MRDLVYAAFASLDGVVDSPGGQQEGHRSGGWVADAAEFLPEAFSLKAEELEETSALMFGRRSYEEFAAMWPGSDDHVASGDARAGRALALPETQSPAHGCDRRHLRDVVARAGPDRVDPRRVGRTGLEP